MFMLTSALTSNYYAVLMHFILITTHLNYILTTLKAYVVISTKPWSRPTFSPFVVIHLWGEYASGVLSQQD